VAECVGDAVQEGWREFVGKTVRLKEEVVVRTERQEHVETVRETVRQDEIEIEHADAKRSARQRVPARG